LLIIAWTNRNVSGNRTDRPRNTERSTSEESVLLGRCEELVFEPDEPAGLSWRGCGV